MSLEGLKLPACLDVPDFDRVLLTSCSQPLAIRAEGHVQTPSGDPRLEDAVSLLNLIEALRVPGLPNSVTAGRRQPPSILVGAEDQSVDTALVRTELVDLSAGLGIPDFHAPIRFSRDQVLAVAAERHSVVGPACLGPEFEIFPSVDRVPDLDARPPTIIRAAGRGDAPAVGRLPGHGPSQVLVSREIEEHPPGRRVPDFHDAAVTGRSNLLAVGAERHAPDFIVVLERQEFLAVVLPDRGRVPDAYGPVGAGRRKAPAVGIGAEGQA